MNSSDGCGDDTIWYNLTYEVCDFNCTQNADCLSGDYCNQSQDCSNQVGTGIECGDDITYLNTDPENNGACISGYCRTTIGGTDNDKYCANSSTDCVDYDGSLPANSYYTGYQACEPGQDADFVCTNGFWSGANACPDQVCDGIDDYLTDSVCHNVTGCTTPSSIDCGACLTCDSGSCVDGYEGIQDDNGANTCDGECQVCISGSCEAAINQTDPGDHCLGINCSDSYYYGWVTLTCFKAANISSVNHVCNAFGECETAPEVCGDVQGPSSGVSANCSASRNLSTCVAQIYPTYNDSVCLCVPNLVNITNSSTMIQGCNASNVTLWQNVTIEVDLNNCTANTTYYINYTKPCVYNVTCNSTWAYTAWVEQQGCNYSNVILQNRTRYDICGNWSNVTEYQEVGCDNCSQSINCSGWTPWSNVSLSCGIRYRNCSDANYLICCGASPLLAADCYYLDNFTYQGNYTFNQTSACPSGLCATVEDLKDQSSIIGIILTQILIILFFAAVGYGAYLLNKLDMRKWSFYIAVTSWGMVLIEVCVTLGIVYVHEANGVLSDLLRINFYGISIIGIAVGIGVISLIALNLMSLDNKRDKWGRKWQNR